MKSVEHILSSRSISQPDRSPSRSAREIEDSINEIDEFLKRSNSNRQKTPEKDDDALLSKLTKTTAKTNVQEFQNLENLKKIRKLSNSVNEKASVIKMKKNIPKSPSTISKQKIQNLLSMQSNQISVDKNTSKNKNSITNTITHENDDVKEFFSNNAKNNNNNIDEEFAISSNTYYKNQSLIDDERNIQNLNEVKTVTFREAKFKT